MSVVIIRQPCHLHQFLLLPTRTLSFNWQNPRFIPVHPLTVFISMISQKRATVLEPHKQRGLTVFTHAVDTGRTLDRKVKQSHRQLVSSE